MYLFTRAGRFTPGSMREAMGFTRAVTEKVRQESGMEIHPWVSTMSPDLGTVLWTTFVEDLPHLEEGNDKLQTSDSFMDLAEGGSRLFAGPLSDSVAQIVSGQPDLTAPLPHYVVTAAASPANGHLRDAITNGTEVAEAITRITGSRCMFMVDVTGPYGGCRWGTGFASIGELERAQLALMADESWIDLVDRVGPSYQQDARQAIYRRAD